MGDRVILHSDMNSFYASVETALNPSLEGKAIAVCGSVDTRHGICLAKSEKAKKAGVKTGMAVWEAKRCCPDLIIVPPHYDVYLEYSKRSHEIYSRYTNQIEPFGMDECWLDITGCIGVCSDGESAAREIRQVIKKELGVTVSVGISYNKIFAKLGSDLKKPDAQTVIKKDDFRERIWPLPVYELLYVGRATTAKIAKYGIRTIGDLARTDPEFLRKILGINGLMLWRYANGLDDSRVMYAGYEPPVKSFGHGITCISDLVNREEVWLVMLDLSQNLGLRLREHGLRAMGVQIMVRGAGLGFKQYQKQLLRATQSPMDIARAGMELFDAEYEWNENVRAVSVRAISLTRDNVPVQLSIYEDYGKIERRERLDGAVDKIKRKYGKRSILPASLLCEKKVPHDNRELVILPGFMHQ